LRIFFASFEFFRNLQETSPPSCSIKTRSKFCIFALPAYQAYGALDADFRPNRWTSAREEVKFTGKEEDIEVGLSYFGSRYYAAHLGQWASADPLTIHGFDSDLNPYAYVRGAVMRSLDPTGLVDIDALMATTGDDWDTREHHWVGLIGSMIREHRAHAGSGGAPRDSALPERELTIELGGRDYQDRGSDTRSGSSRSDPVRSIGGAINDFVLKNVASLGSMVFSSPFCQLFCSPGLSETHLEYLPEAVGTSPENKDLVYWSALIPLEAIEIYSAEAGQAGKATKGFSVAFSAKLNKEQRGLGERQHFEEANKQLKEALKVTPALATIVEKPTRWGTPPKGWVWHHATRSQAPNQEKGWMYLSPGRNNPFEGQHVPGSRFWRNLHPLPYGGGGYQEWAVPAGAPAR
jgi:RHS repeat-associated protein